jgi:hypothetical protein
MQVILRATRMITNEEKVVSVPICTKQRVSGQGGCITLLLRVVSNVV